MLLWVESDGLARKRDVLCNGLLARRLAMARKADHRLYHERQKQFMIPNQRRFEPTRWYQSITLPSVFQSAAVKGTYLESFTPKI